MSFKAYRTIFVLLIAVFSVTTTGFSYMLWAYPDLPPHILSYKDIVISGAGIAVSCVMLYITEKMEQSVEQNRSDCKKEI